MNKIDLAEAVTKSLIKANMTISFMESCTSGLLASMFTDTEGASAVFFGSLVTYSNESKVDSGVNKDVIEQNGVYSSECAYEMARATKEHYKTDIAVGITGNTGNVDPNNPEGIAGEAYYCIICGTETYNKHIKIDVTGMSRKEIKQYYADKVYASIFEILQSTAKGIESLE